MVKKIKYESKLERHVFILNSGSCQKKTRLSFYILFIIKIAANIQKALIYVQTILTNNDCVANVNLKINKKRTEHNVSVRSFGLDTIKVCLRHRKKRKPNT
jgi:hypothetical protein